MLTTYRLARQTGGLSRFAAVTIEVAPAEHHEVTVATDANPVPAWRSEAEFGAWRALRGLAPHRITVTNVADSIAHTGVGDVHEATARAVWQALHPDPQPPYTGFSELTLVQTWLHDRIGMRIQSVVEARHWHNGQREPDAESLIHAWLTFEHYPPTLLHRVGDELLLSIEKPYIPHNMSEHGQTRIEPARPPDLLASIIGARLTNAAAIVSPFDDQRCAGLLLQLGTKTVTIATADNEWVLTTEDIP